MGTHAAPVAAAIGSDVLDKEGGNPFHIKDKLGEGNTVWIQSAQLGCEDPFIRTSS